MLAILFLKLTVKLRETIVPIHRKMVALLTFSKICQKCILFGQYLLTPQTPGMFLLGCIICAKGNKVTQTLVYDKRPAKNATLSFSVFSLFQFQSDFWQKFYEKSYHFSTSFKFPQCQKTLSCLWMIPENCKAFFVC